MSCRHGREFSLSVPAVFEYSSPVQENETPVKKAVSDFGELSPDAVINAVEKALGVRCSNVCRPLSSYINRVYEVGLEDGGYVVAKFYRPNRWSRDALQDELDFLRELHEAEVSVVPPLPGKDGARLHDLSGTSFAVFPKKGGRPLDEPSRKDWIHLGRLIARMHAVGASHAPRDRIRMHPRHSTQQHLHFILESGAVPAKHRAAYERTVLDLIEFIAPWFDDVDTLRIHADCHRGNILHRPGEGYHLLDFDDMAVGPAVQDLWMILPDRLARARAEMNLMLEGYETFRDFDCRSLRLIEPLRAMRFIHYTAWCARQKADGGFARMSPGWGTAEFWQQEINDLQTQRQEIVDSAE
jgi:Ser/Thr protein kinase RdoA (MazF antagonist)